MKRGRSFEIKDIEDDEPNESPINMSEKPTSFFKDDFNLTPD